MNGISMRIMKYLLFNPNSNASEIASVVNDNEINTRRALDHLSSYTVKTVVREIRKRPHKSGKVYNYKCRINVYRLKTWEEFSIASKNKQTNSKTGKCIEKVCGSDPYAQE